jgi:hypothetical protein
MAQSAPMRHAQLIQTLGGRAKVSRGIGQNYQNIRGWVERDNIPAEHWPALIKFAKSIGIVVSTDELAAGAAASFAEKRARRSAQAANDAADAEEAGAA